MRESERRQNNTSTKDFKWTHWGKDRTIDSNIRMETRGNTNDKVNNMIKTKQRPIRN